MHLLNSAFGAVAEVFDASCFATKPQFATIQNPAFAAWNTSRPPPIQDIIARLATTNNPLVLGQHYFVTNPVTGTGISPKWDFTSSGKFKGNADAFVIGAPKANIPAPSNPQQNVPWLDIRNVQGKLADQIFRFDTVGGQPPASVRGSSFIEILRLYAHVLCSLVHARQGHEPFGEVCCEVWYVLPSLWSDDDVVYDTDSLLRSTFALALYGGTIA